jgi:transcriptional regulator with PAS, ATPase and Fis domain
MHIVGETGIPEINQPQRIKGQDMVVQRIPVKVNGQIVVYGQVMFKDVRDVRALAKELNVLESKVELYEKELASLRSSKYTIGNIIGESQAIKEVKNLALKAAQTNAPVLLIGESGTGKELFAHAIHYASERRIYPFIRLNCAAIPKDLLESELFGYEPGAFTGAGNKGKPGKFELAHRGSIFLDEISDLPLDMQPKLLRVLEEKEMERLGGTRLTKSDFRLIAATSTDLEVLVEKGSFRKDLYYRLNVLPIHIPPLRERKEDIPLLANYFVQKISKEMGTKIVSISPQVLQIFQDYSWPGNVRELSNLIERILYTIESDMIQVHHLPLPLQNFGGDLGNFNSTLLRSIKENMERDTLLHYLRLTKNNKKKAAELLGIHRTSLYKKMKRLNITV